MDNKQAYFQTKSVNEDGNIKVVLSKQIYDRDDEILDIAGCDLENFIKAPRMLWQHRSYNPEVQDILGSWREVQKNTIDGVPVLVASPEFADHPTAQYVKRMVNQGHLNTVSVGYRVKEYDVENRKVMSWELYEASWVAIPANVEAMVVEKGMKLVDAIESGQKSLDEDMYKKLVNYEKMYPTMRFVRKNLLSNDFCKQIGYNKGESELVDVQNIYEILKGLISVKQEAPVDEVVQEAPVITKDDIKNLVDVLGEFKKAMSA